jgi:hypothetical protein
VVFVVFVVFFVVHVLSEVNTIVGTFSVALFESFTGVGLLPRQRRPATFDGDVLNEDWIKIIKLCWLFAFSFRPCGE